MDYYGARNKVLFAWHNIPFPAVAHQLAGRTAKAMVFSLQPARMVTRCRGLLNAYLVCAMGRAARRPVAPDVFRLSQELKLRRYAPVDELSSRLPDLNSVEIGNGERLKMAVGI